MAGDIYHRAVATGLECISSGVLTVSGLADNLRTIIAYGGATSERVRPAGGVLTGPCPYKRDTHELALESQASLNSWRNTSDFVVISSLEGGIRIRPSTWSLPA